MAELSMGTLYDANRALMNTKDEKTNTYKFQPLQHLELIQKQQEIEDFFNWNCDCYAMLYCRQLSDITIFHMYENQNPNPPAIAAKECLGCCTDRGEILSIEEQPDGNYEFWIRIKDNDNKTENVFAYYLFPYDNAVIEC